MIKLKPLPLVKEKNHRYPHLNEAIQAGFPSPATDFQENKLDLNEHLIKNPAATYFVTVSGDSMENAGIFSGDILIIDRSIEPQHRHIIIAALDGELTVKRLIITKSGTELHSENINYPPISIPELADFSVWGVVTYVIHQLR